MCHEKASKIHILGPVKLTLYISKLLTYDEHVMSK